MTPLIIKPVRKGSKEEHIQWAISLGCTKGEGAEHWESLEGCVQHVNDEYIVLVRLAPDDMNPFKIEGLLWLSIRRTDGSPTRSWYDMQSIKSHVLGKEGEAIEIFPAESRLVDEVNQYHLFGCCNKEFPVGFGGAK